MGNIIVAAEDDVFTFGNGFVAVIKDRIAEAYLVVYSLTGFLAVWKVAVDQFVIRIFEDDAPSFGVELVDAEGFDTQRFFFSVGYNAAVALLLGLSKP